MKYNEKHSEFVKLHSEFVMKDKQEMKHKLIQVLIDRK